jgi:hypothetical protein
VGQPRRGNGGAGYLSRTWVTSIEPHRRSIGPSFRSHSGTWLTSIELGARKRKRCEGGSGGSGI